jgi:hypothetical protein
MTTLSVDALRAEHEQLSVHVDHLRDAARELPELSPEERTLLVHRMLGFLRGTLIPHAEAEETGLYAEVRRLLGDDRVTDPMSYDHQAIERMVDGLERTPVDHTAQLQELLYGLALLIEVHFRKEEAFYLELLQDAETVLRHEP